MNQANSNYSIKISRLQKDSSLEKWVLAVIVLSVLFYFVAACLMALIILCKVFAIPKNTKIYNLGYIREEEERKQTRVLRTLAVMKSGIYKDLSIVYKSQE